MINIRMFAIAGALFLIVPVGVMAGPLQDTVDAAVQEGASVTNIDVLRPAQKCAPISGDLRPEQLVEGHTTFVTMDAVSDCKVLEGNVTVDGLVHCETHGSLRTSWIYVAGVAVPIVTHVDGASEECNLGGRVVVTPTIYCTLTGDAQCNFSPANTQSAPIMFPTGNSIPVMSPDKQYGYAEEYSFAAGDRTYFAWATPIMRPWIDPAGHMKDFLVPVPAERLREMDTSDFHIVFEDQVHEA